MPAGDIRGACTTIRSSAQHVDFKEPNIEYRRNSFFIENGMLTPAQIHKRRERYSSLETEITTQSANYKGRKRWKMELPLLLEKVGREHANRNKLVALRTLQLRRQTMFHFFSELMSWVTNCPLSIHFEKSTQGFYSLIGKKQVLLPQRCNPVTPVCSYLPHG